MTRKKVSFYVTIPKKHRKLKVAFYEVIPGEKHKKRKFKPKW